MSGLSQLVFDGLQVMLYDDCSRFVVGVFSVLLSENQLHEENLKTLHLNNDLKKINKLHAATKSLIRVDLSPIFREVRQTVAKVITSLGLHAKMLQVVVRYFHLLCGVQIEDSLFQFASLSPYLWHRL